MDPRLVCVGTISRVVGRLLKVPTSHKIRFQTSSFINFSAGVLFSRVVTLFEIVRFQRKNLQCLLVEDDITNSSKQNIAFQTQYIFFEQTEGKSLWYL
jgi:hypothetical protein